MIILAFDSTAKVASVAICNDEHPLAIYNIDNGLTQSELLLPMAEDMLKSLHLSFNDVELLTCTTGPGSFTGVRIGTSLIKGIAFGKNIPCVEVSTLESLAENASGLNGVIVPVMDARRSQVYTAIFESQNGTLIRKYADDAISLAELADRLKTYKNTAIYLVGDGYTVAKKALYDFGITVSETPPLLISENAYSCARVALNKYRSGNFIDDKSLSPYYLRLPQAERERLERLNSKKTSY